MEEEKTCYKQGLRVCWVSWWTKLGNWVGRRGRCELESMSKASRGWGWTTARGKMREMAQWWIVQSVPRDGAQQRGWEKTLNEQWRKKKEAILSFSCFIFLHNFIYTYICTSWVRSLLLRGGMESGGHGRVGCPLIEEHVVVVKKKNPHSFTCVYVYISP